MDYIISGSTDIGNVKSTNQDSFTMKRFSTSHGNMVLAILCDGMGGLANGEVASSNVVRAFSDWGMNELPYMVERGITDTEIRAAWNGIVQSCNTRIHAYGAEKGIRLGTTLNMLLLTDERFSIINVGDTRCYEISDSLRQITKDQSVVQREIDLGNLTPEEAERDPRRSILLQCIGASDMVYPEFFFGETKRNAVYMLCTDGFRHVITKDEIYDALNPNRMNSAEEMRTQSEMLIALNKERQEKDNITVLTVRTI